MAAWLTTLRPCWLAGVDVFDPNDCETERCVDMKPALSIATIAFLFAARPIATTIDMPLARSAASFAVAEAAGQNTASAWDGQWQGTTVSGQQLVLELRVKGQRMTGRLKVGK